MNTDAIYARANAFFTPRPPLPIKHGNRDIESSCGWVPTVAVPRAADLPIYPTPADLLIEVRA